MHDIFRIRRATLQDVDIIAWHRARMFQDMGDVSDDAFEILRAKARLRLKEWFENGDYIGWVATPADKSFAAPTFACNRSCRARSMHRELAKARGERL
jgi:hypothetical protein